MVDYRVKRTWADNPEANTDDVLTIEELRRTWPNFYPTVRLSGFCELRLVDEDFLVSTQITVMDSRNNATI